MDSSHQVELIALEGAKITGIMFSGNLQICKISLELWIPVLRDEIPSTNLAVKSEVVISHICSSNFCYVRLSQNLQHQRLLLDINYFSQNSSM